MNDVQLIDKAISGRVSALKRLEKGRRTSRNAKIVLNFQTRRTGPSDATITRLFSSIQDLHSVA